MTELEIYTILTLWALDGEEVPHEPKLGQISMEQAIDIGKKEISNFSEQGILFKKFIAYEKINAYLCTRKLDPSKLIPTSPFIKPDDIRSEQELDLFYSYWTLSFSSENAAITLLIHAATGQIWKFKADCSVLNADF